MFKIKKLFKKIDSFIQSKKLQNKLTNEVEQSILSLELKEIIKHLKKQDKSFLVGIILSQKITDNSDIHYFYEKLKSHKTILKESI